MNQTTTVDSARFQLNEKKADRLGVAASVLCAIHCAVAPVLLIALPTFGKIWAHPASHALVAIFIVPLAAFSILKGYRKHQKRWILVSAMIGIFFVLGGAALPAFTKFQSLSPEAATSAAPVTESAVAGTDESSCEASCEAGCEAETSCEGCASEAVDESETTEAAAGGTANTLHIPPAAIITTLGGVFLIAAHIGNLRSGAGACMTADCRSCES
jgi:hypothetical protein